MRIVIGVLIGCAWIGCARGGAGDRPGGDGDGGGDGSGSGSGSGGNEEIPVGSMLTVEPQASEFLIVNGAAVQKAFTAVLVGSDGSRRDVTAAARFRIADRYGRFAGNTVTVGPSAATEFAAGRTKVVVDYGRMTAMADVVVRIKQVRFADSLPPTTEAVFAGIEDAQRAPTVVYPPPDTVMPRNLGDFEVHWVDGHANDVFEISLRTELSDIRVYVTGGNGPQGPTTSWRAFEAAEWRAAVGGETAVTVQVRAARRAAPGPVGAAPGRIVGLSNEDMDGAVYYWATTSLSGASGIYRHDMANPSPEPEEFLTTNQTQGRCVACHVLSRDGKAMAITYQNTGQGDPGMATTVDVASKVIARERTEWEFATFTPDNKQLLAVENGVLKVRDAASHGELVTMFITPANARVTHPELSPDGTKLVYVHIPFDGWHKDHTFKLGQIHVRSYDPASRTFGEPRVLVADGGTNYSPSWSPDGQWIAFNKGLGTEFNYDARAATVWAIRADGSQPPISLARANQETGVTNTSVRWAPFAQSFGVDEEPMFWLTFSSKRDFGVRLLNSSFPQTAGKRAQLWMTPFFPARASRGIDPSVPAFRLPFQRLESSNQTAQWAERVATETP